MKIWKMSLDAPAALGTVLVVWDAAIFPESGSAIAAETAWSCVSKKWDKLRSRAMTSDRTSILLVEQR